MNFRAVRSSDSGWAIQSQGGMDPASACELAVLMEKLTDPENLRAMNVAVENSIQSRLDRMFRT